MQVFPDLVWAELAFAGEQTTAPSCLRGLNLAADAYAAWVGGG
jgi:hypothetical protein